MFDRRRGSGAQNHRTAAYMQNIPHKKTNLPGLLIADEDAEYRQKVCKAFEAQYEVMQACDAESALSLIKAFGSDGISAVLLSMTLSGD